MNRCEYCKYCNHLDAKARNGHHECRRLSQRVVGIEGEGYEWEWALVKPDDWCGEFEPRDGDK